MKTWNNPQITELDVAATAHGDAPIFPLDGAYTANGLPYGADKSDES